MDLQEEDKYLHWEFKNGTLLRPLGRSGEEAGSGGTRERRRGGYAPGGLLPGAQTTV